MSDALSLLYEGLRSKLTTKRKSALKSLVTFLEQQQQADEESRGGNSNATTWLRRFDAATAAIPTGAALPQSTWPALLHETIKCVSVEIGLGTSRDGTLRDPPRPADVSAARALRAVVSAADSAARRPRGVPALAAATAASGAAALTTSPAAASPPLARRASKLLRHVRDVLLAAPISGNALSAEYALLLRVQLLPPRADANAYLARAPAAVVRDLIAWAAGAAEAAVRGRRTAAEEEERKALGTTATAAAASNAPVAAASSFAAEAEQALSILALLLRCASCDVGSEAREASYRAISRVATALNAAAAAAAEEGLADLTAGGVGGGGDGGKSATTNDAAAAGLAAAATALSRLDPSPLAVPVYARVHGALLQAAAALLEREGTEMTATSAAGGRGTAGNVRQLSLLCRPSAAAAWRALGPSGRSSRDKRIRAAAVAYVSALSATGKLHDDAEFVGFGGGGVAVPPAANANAVSTSFSSATAAQSASSLIELLCWVRGAVANEAFAGWKKAGPESAALGPSTPGGRRALLRLAAAVEAAAGLSRHAPSLRAAAAASSSSSSSPSANSPAAAATAVAAAEAAGDEGEDEEEDEGEEERRGSSRGGSSLPPSSAEAAAADRAHPPFRAAPDPASKRRKTNAAAAAPVSISAVAPLPLPPPLARVVASRAGSAARWAPVAAAALLSMAPGPSARDVAGMLAGAAEVSRRLRAPAAAPRGAAAAASAVAAHAAVQPATAEAAVSLLRLLEAAVVSCPRSLLRTLRKNGGGGGRFDDEDDDEEEEEENGGGGGDSADDETSDEEGGGSEDGEEGNAHRRRRRRRRSLSAAASAALASLTSWAAAWLGCPKAPHSLVDAAAAALAAVARRGLLVGSSATAAARRIGSASGGNASPSSSSAYLVPVSVAAAAALASSPGLLYSRDPLPRPLLALLAAAPPVHLAAPSTGPSSTAATNVSAPSPATNARGALLERVLSRRTLATSPALAAAAATALLGRSNGGVSSSSSSSPSLRAAALDDFEAESLADFCFDPSCAALPQLSFADLATPPPHAPPRIAGEAGQLLDAPPLAHPAPSHSASASSSSSSAAAAAVCSSSCSTSTSPVEATTALDRATRAHRAARARAELARLPAPIVPLTGAAAGAAANSAAVALAAALESGRRDSQGTARHAQEAAQNEILAAANLSAACAAAAAGNDGGMLNPAVVEERRLALERLRFSAVASQDADLALLGAWHAAWVVCVVAEDTGGEKGERGGNEGDDESDDDDASGLAASTHLAPFAALSSRGGRVSSLLSESAPAVASAAVRVTERAGFLGPKRGDPARDELVLRSLSSLAAAVAASSSAAAGSAPPRAAMEEEAETLPLHPSLALSGALEAASRELARLCADADSSADLAVQAAATAAAGTLSDDELDDENDSGGGFGFGVTQLTGAAPAAFGRGEQQQHDDFDLTAAAAFPSTLTLGISVGGFGGGGGGGFIGAGSAVAAALATARRDGAVRALAATARAVPLASARALASIAERWVLGLDADPLSQAMDTTQDGEGDYETPPPPAAVERLLAALVGVARISAVSPLLLIDGADSSTSPAASQAATLILRGGLLAPRKDSAFAPSRALLVGAWAVAGLARAALDRCAALSSSSSSSPFSESRRLRIDATRSDAADLLLDPLLALVKFAEGQFGAARGDDDDDEGITAAALSGPGFFARAALATAASACLAAGGAKHWTEENAEVVIDVVVDGGVKVPTEQPREQRRGGGAGRQRQAAAAEQPAKPAFALRLATATSAAHLPRISLHPSVLLLHLERSACLGDPLTGEVTRDGAGLALLGASLAAAEGGWVPLCPALDAAPPPSCLSASSASADYSPSPYLLRQEAKCSEDADAQERVAARALLSAAGVAALSSAGAGAGSDGNVRLQRTARAALRAGAVALGYGSRAQYVRARALWIARDWTGVGYDDAAAAARAAANGGGEGGLTPQGTATTGTPQRQPSPPRQGELTVLPRPMIPISVLAAAAPAVGGSLRTGKALLRELSAHLVPALAVNQDGLGLRALAAAVGEGSHNDADPASLDRAAAALVREHYASIMTAVLPGSRHYGLGTGGGGASGGGESTNGSAAAAPLHGGDKSYVLGQGLLRDLIPSVEEADELFERSVPRAVAEILLLAASGEGWGVDLWGRQSSGGSAAPTASSSPANVVDEGEEDEKATPFPALGPIYAADAAHSLLRALNRETEAQGPAPLRALVRARAAAAAARGRRHRAAALGPLRAVVAFLAPEGAATAGAAFAAASTFVETALAERGPLARACCGALRRLLCLEDGFGGGGDGNGGDGGDGTLAAGLEGSAPRLLSLLCGAASASAAEVVVSEPLLALAAAFASRFPREVAAECDVPPAPQALAPVRAALLLRRRRSSGNNVFAGLPPSSSSSPSSSFIDDLVRFSLRAPSLAPASREAEARKLRKRLRASPSLSSPEAAGAAATSTTTLPSLLLPTMQREELLEEGGDGESAERAAVEASAAARRAAWRLVRAGVAAADESPSSSQAVFASAAASAESSSSSSQLGSHPSCSSSSATLRLAADVLATLGPLKVGADLPPINGVSTVGRSSGANPASAAPASGRGGGGGVGAAPDLRSALASLFPLLVDAVEACCPSPKLASIAQDCLESLAALPEAKEALERIGRVAADAEERRSVARRRSSSGDPEAEAAASAALAAADAAARVVPYGVPITLQYRRSGEGDPATTVPRRSPPPQLTGGGGGGGGAAAAGVAANAAETAAAAAAAAAATLDDPWPLLLEPGRLPPSQWVRRLASATLRRARAPELRACAAFALADHAAAGLLLPHALADLALDSSDVSSAAENAASSAAPRPGIAGELAAVFDSALAAACSSSSASLRLLLPKPTATSPTPTPSPAYSSAASTTSAASREEAFSRAPPLRERPSSPASKRWPAYKESEDAERTGPMGWPSVCWLPIRYETVGACGARVLRGPARRAVLGGACSGGARGEPRRAEGDGRDGRSRGAVPETRRRCQRSRRRDHRCRCR